MYAFLKKGVNTPIKKNIIANLFKIIILFIEKVAIVPLYIKYWGIALYGDWLVITAITSFFVMSDMGLNNVSNNRFCMKYAEKNFSECNSLIINNIILIGSIGIISTIGMIIFVLNSNLQLILGLHAIDNSTAALILVILCIQVFLNMLGGVFDSIYNASHLASRATYINNFTKLAYAIILLLCIVFNIELKHLIFCIIVPYILGFTFKIIDSRKYYRYKLQLNSFDKKLFIKLITPSLSYLMFPMSNAISFQGYTLIVNYALGAPALVLFNTTRTLVNFIRTLVEAITHAVKPELSIAYGERNKVKLKRVYKKSLFLTLILASTCSVFLVLFGDYIYKIWTHGTIMFNLDLMLAFMLVIILNTLQNSSSVIIHSTNNHQFVAIITLILSIIGIIIAYVIAPLQHLPLIALTIAIPEIAIVIYAYFKVNNIINNINTKTI